ncbi:hypothetical protein F5Y15DRAFT_12111 [Xylariaceae sp. FL0016]|nr:hypothetical protein F5Y15DRAFT_12111 [Xylariaceae sp. FL0016]
MRQHSAWTKWRPSWMSSTSSTDDERREMTGEALSDSNTLQPHRGQSDDYLNGDIYDQQPWEVEKIWDDSVDLKKMPYLTHIKSLSQTWPHLRFLSQWMLVTTTPVKWQLICNHPNIDRIRSERASRCHVAALDFVQGQSPPRMETINNVTRLAESLGDIKRNGTQGKTRLYVVEDLSRDVIELLGWNLDIDPLFFREQINDYQWYNTRDPWVELPDLHVVSKHRSFFYLEYMHARYFKSYELFKSAIAEAGMFNVLRRMDDDSDHGSIFDKDGAVVALVRSKTSLWIRPCKRGEDTVAVLLVDPSIKTGRSLWNGYRPFACSPSPSEARQTYEPPPRDTLFNDVCYWMQHMSLGDINAIRDNPKIVAYRMVQIICSEWLLLSSYITARLRQIEWEVERTDFRADIQQGIDASLGKSHTWRRRLPMYRNWIQDARKKLFRDLGTAPNDCLADLQEDFEIAARGLEGLQQQLERITAVTTAVAAFEESRRAVEQNRSLGNLTYLAVIFAPLSFVSSFFSMTPSLNDLGQTFGIYFSVAIPISLAVLYLVLDQSWTQWLPGLSKWKKERAAKMNGEQKRMGTLKS